MVNLIIFGWRKGGNGMKLNEASIFNLDEKYVTRARCIKFRTFQFAFLKHY